MLAHSPLRLEHDLVEAQYGALDAILMDADMLHRLMLARARRWRCVMHEAVYVVADAMLIGTGATATADLWSMLRRKLLDVPMPDYGLVGRWLAYLPCGRFFHDPIAATPPV